MRSVPCRLSPPTYNVYSVHCFQPLRINCLGIRGWNAEAQAQILVSHFSRVDDQAVKSKPGCSYIVQGKFLGIITATHHHHQHHHLPFALFLHFFADHFLTRLIRFALFFFFFLYTPCSSNEKWGSRLSKRWFCCCLSTFKFAQEMRVRIRVGIGNPGLSRSSPFTPPAHFYAKDVDSVIKNTNAPIHNFFLLLFRFNFSQLRKQGLAGGTVYARSYYQNIFSSSEDITLSEMKLIFYFSNRWDGWEDISFAGVEWGSETLVEKYTKITFHRRSVICILGLFNSWGTSGIRCRFSQERSAEELSPSQTVVSNQFRNGTCKG